MEIQLNQSGIRFCYFTDVHLSARPPGRRVDNYGEAILNKLRFASDWAHSQNMLGLCGGDVFHVKSSTSVANPHHLINKAMETFQSFPGGRVYGIVGNHDVVNDDIDSLPNQPLGVLIQSGCYNRINEPTVFTDVNGLTVEVVPFDFGDEMLALQAMLDYPRERTTDYRIGICHAMSRTGGAQVMFGHPIIGYNQLEDIAFDAMLWGHDHSYIPDTEVGECLHIHPGSLARAALDYDEVERDIHLVGLSFKTKDTWGLKHKIIPVTPIEAAFRVLDTVTAAENTEVSSFVAEMKSRVGSIEVIDALTTIHEVCKDEPDMERIILDACEY